MKIGIDNAINLIKCRLRRDVGKQVLVLRCNSWSNLTLGNPLRLGHKVVRLLAPEALGTLKALHLIDQVVKRNLVVALQLLVVHPAAAQLVDEFPQALRAHKLVLGPLRCPKNQPWEYNAAIHPRDFVLGRLSCPH